MEWPKLILSTHYKLILLAHHCLTLLSHYKLILLTHYCLTLLAYLILIWQLLVPSFQILKVFAKHRTLMRPVQRLLLEYPLQLEVAAVRHERVRAYRLRADYLRAPPKSNEGFGLFGSKF